MKPTIIAREVEQRVLLNLYRGESSELVSVTGRRRVGKTFLITATLAGKIDFSLTGVQGGSKTEQLRNFGDSMARHRGASREEVTPTSWQDAFFALADYLEQLDKKEKLVVFLDELPWLATSRSGFLSAFSYFWNSWAERRNIMVVICGSAASWMINKVVRHKGGLHNRITKRLQLAPFTLRETRKFLEFNGLVYSDYDIAELYMCVGGIPFYLAQFNPNLSVAQNIDQVVVGRFGVLHDEFSRLYPALFDHADRHILVVRALGRHVYGLNRQQIIKETGLSDGGGLTRILEELEFSGFIQAFYAFGKKRKARRYRLIDEYSNFYLRFIEPQRGESSWQQLRTGQAYISWTGYAFENLGFRHIKQIKEAIGISGVATSSSSFYHKAEGKATGLQIDLLIERADRAINLCEFKFYNQPLALSKDQIKKYQNRLQIFRELTGTNHTLFNTLIAPYGLKANTNKGGVINQSIALNDLFAN